MTTDDYADRLAKVASELAVRVRDETPNDNAEWLRTVLPDRDDRDNLIFVLAAAVPDDRSWRALTSWTTVPAVRRLQPHGTHAAAARHRYHHEALCDACRDAEQARDRDRKRAAYRAAKTEPASTRRTAA